MRKLTERLTFGILIIVMIVIAAKYYYPPSIEKRAETATKKWIMEHVNDPTDLEILSIWVCDYEFRESQRKEYGLDIFSFPTVEDDEPGVLRSSCRFRAKNAFGVLMLGSFELLLKNIGDYDRHNLLITDFRINKKGL